MFLFVCFRLSAEVCSGWIVCSCRCRVCHEVCDKHIKSEKRCDALEEELRAAIASRDAVEEMLRAAWIRIQKLERLVVSKQKTKIGLRKFAKRDHWKKAIDDAKELWTASTNCAILRSTSYFQSVSSSKTSIAWRRADQLQHWWHLGFYWCSGGMTALMLRRSFSPSWLMARRWTQMCWLHNMQSNLVEFLPSYTTKSTSISWIKMEQSFHGWLHHSRQKFCINHI